MTTNDNDRVALITGVSRGLGLALATALVGQGWRVIGDGRNAQRLAAVTYIDGPGWIEAVPGDVADPDHRSALAAAVAAAGRLDLLVNNASVLGPSPQPALADYSLEAFRAVYEVNVFAPLALVQLVRAELDRSGGRIVNVTSDAAVEPYAGWGGYGSSKAALEQFTAILGAEHPDLRVYAFDPGDMNTDLHQLAFPGEDISDRPVPESVVPALLTLLDSDLPSGRYRGADLAPQSDGHPVGVDVI